MSHDELRAKATRWMDDDPDPTTRAELADLLARGAWDEIADRFAGRLEFGTAGLRGVLGAGPNRMNVAVVRAATRGLVVHLLEQIPDAAKRGIVIGYDGRHMSPELAREAAEVAAGAGVRVRLFDGVVPSPVLADARGAEGAAGAVMVTASHNPPEYNGYKVYWSNGAQIIPPVDAGIAAAIERVGPLAAVPRTSLEEARAEGLVTSLGAEMIDRYHAAIAELTVARDAPSSELVIAYTALHGVGDVHVRRALAGAGFTRVHSVADQAEPDGDFPTVAFPNPEEKGAMDRALALAAEVGAEHVRANDPDANRLAVAVPRASGGYRMLTGNEIGCLLAHYTLSRAPGERRLVVSSLVSSPMLGAIAAHHGARWEETLTGFKWIANRAMELEPEGWRFVMGYEEALGYTIGPLVRDKDGVGAALVFADFARSLASEGRTVEDELDVCARRYGLYLSRQVSVTRKGEHGAAEIAAIMSAVRASPPERVGSLAVTAVRDLARGEARFPDGRTETLAFPPSNVISLDLEGGHRIMLRPSGTEPKIKYYFDVRETIGAKEATDAARARGERTLEMLVAAFTEIVGART